LGAIIFSKDFLLVFVTRYLADCSFAIVKATLLETHHATGYWLLAIGYWLLTLAGLGGLILLYRKQRHRLGLSWSLSG
jgi:hypothetical protein